MSTTVISGSFPNVHFIGSPTDWTLFMDEIRQGKIRPQVCHESRGKIAEWDLTDVEICFENSETGKPCEPTYFPVFLSFKSISMDSTDEGDKLAVIHPRWVRPDVKAFARHQSRK
jgi:hypothetical protein